jgi:hypothetical protein
MVEIELHGMRASSHYGRWRSAHRALAEILNAPWNQPDPMRYRLDPDLDNAEHVVKTMGARIIQQDALVSVPGQVN